MSSFARAIRFLSLLQANRRMTVRRLAKEMDTSERSVYRYVNAVSDLLPIRLEEGVVILDSTPNNPPPEIGLRID